MAADAQASAPRGALRWPIRFRVVDLIPASTGPPAENRIANFGPSSGDGAYETGESIDDAAKGARPASVGGAFTAQVTQPTDCYVLSGN